MLGNIYRLQQSLAVVLQGTLGGGGRGEGGCPARFLNHELLSDQNLPCFIPFFRSGL